MSETGPAWLTSASNASFFQSRRPPGFREPRAEGNGDHVDRIGEVEAPRQQGDADLVLAEVAHVDLGVLGPQVDLDAEGVLQHRLDRLGRGLLAGDRAARAADPQVHLREALAIGIAGIGQQLARRVGVEVLDLANCRVVGLVAGEAGRSDRVRGYGQILERSIADRVAIDGVRDRLADAQVLVRPILGVEQQVPVGPLGPRVQLFAEHWVGFDSGDVARGRNVQHDVGLAGLVGGEVGRWLAERKLDPLQVARLVAVVVGPRLGGDALALGPVGDRPVAAGSGALQRRVVDVAVACPTGAWRTGADLRRP